MHAGRGIAVIGGGAAGFFAAIAAAERPNNARVTIYEATRQPLYKVGISGGGRCNVTHNCYEPEELTKGYPRGHKELASVFRRFQPRDTVRWFERRGVKLKAEPDGRIFPVSDDSQTIINCLLRSAGDTGVTLRMPARVAAVRTVHAWESGRRFEVVLKDGTVELHDAVLLATGSSPQGYQIAQALGHTIVPCVPSLFTFKIKDLRLQGLQGLGFPDAELSMTTAGKTLHQSGPVLITHSGLSGPAVLKLSAWGARELYASRYRADLTINWVSGISRQGLNDELKRQREQHPRRAVVNSNFLPLPNRFWARLVQTAGVADGTTWSQLTREATLRLADELVSGRYQVVGKGEFKEEFVTCGGIKLKEVDFNTMESRIVPGLYFAGEILDIDGITGGYNFQSAWSTGWIAGQNLGSREG